MAKTDHQYVKSRDSPLISVSHPTRYLNKTSVPIDYSVMHSGIPTQSHNKNTVVMSNLTYKHEDHGTRRLQPKVEKERTKNLNLQGDKTGVHSRFMHKEMPKHNTYYILCDTENEIHDTYYLHNKPLIHRKVEKPFQTPVNPDSLGIFPPDKKESLSHELDNKNIRLIRNQKDFKEV